MEPATAVNRFEDKTIQRPERFRVDLDAPASERWKEIVEKYLPKILYAQQRIHEDIVTHVGKYVGGTLEYVAETALGIIGRFTNISFREELLAISQLTGLHIGKIVVLQFAYESTAFCTSIVAPRKGDGVPIHARTMDWEMDYLRPLTIEVEFYKDGRFLYQATTWAGYVGILTAVKPKSFSLSINFRCCNSGNLFTNIMSAIRGGWPVAFLVRHVMETASNFDSAVEMMNSEKLVAPSYVTIAGIEPGQGVLITRDRTFADRVLRMQDNNDMIVQTNADFWDEKPKEDILESVTRRKVANEGLRVLNRMQNVTLESIWALMRKEPIRNPVTIYTSLMCAAESFMESWIEVAPVGDPSKFSIF